MKFEFDDDIGIGADDEISVGDGIRRGDIVCFESAGENKFTIRRATEEDVASASVRAYRVERGDEPDSVRFTRVR